jgi:hypothetical protein
MGPGVPLDVVVQPDQLDSFPPCRDRGCDRTALLVETPPGSASVLKIEVPAAGGLPTIDGDQEDWTTLAYVPVPKGGGRCMGSFKFTFKADIVESYRNRQPLTLRFEGDVLPSEVSLVEVSDEVPVVKEMKLLQALHSSQGDVTARMEDHEEIDFLLMDTFSLNYEGPGRALGPDRETDLNFVTLARLCTPDTCGGPVVDFGKQSFVRGDANADGATDISDAVAVLNFLFLGVKKVPCEQAGDANDDGALDISDSVYTLSFLFLGGRRIQPPVGTCGVDPTRHSLPCGNFPGCM